MDRIILPTHDFLRRRRDMSVVAEITTWENLPNGMIKITYLDGHSNLFANLDEVKDYIRTLDTNPVTAEQLLIGWFLARSTDASNTNLVNGKRLTFDLSATNQIRVQ